MTKNDEGAYMKYVYEADILLPKFRLDADKMSRYATIACDQFTSEPEYWDQVMEITKGEISTVNAVLPEIYLDSLYDNKDNIISYMESLLSDTFAEYKNSMIYCERTLPSNGKVRHGIIAAIDLEDYDFNKGAHLPIRSSEETVKERIPARVAIRNGAPIEFSHVLMFYNDPENRLNSYLFAHKKSFETAYDFDLMLGSGNIKGYFISNDAKEFVNAVISAEGKGASPLVMTVGDGNHSLAAAKTCYNKLKELYGEKAKNMKARYATVELVNIHDEAIEFEPIYRLIKNCSPESFIKYFADYCGADEEETEGSFEYTVTGAGVEKKIYIHHPKTALPVGDIQIAVDEFLKSRPECKVDYIHGADSLRKLASSGINTGIMFEGMKKDELFAAVIKDGALPRKTFSMGEAKDKRFYLESARIK